MRRIFSVMTFVFLLPSLLNCQILWRISGNGIEHESYLFGTCEDVPVSYLNDVNDLFKCYNSADVVVSEVIVNEAESIDKMTHSALMLESIREMLTEDEFRIVDSALQAEMRLPLSKVAMMRPVMIKNMYEMTLKERLFPEMKNDGGMDSFFQRMAHRQHKKIVGLTDIDAQIELTFYLQPVERQAKWLVGSVKQSQNMAERVNKLTALYKKGKINDYYDMLVNDTSVYSMSESERYLLYGDRNVKWIDSIESLIKKESCFISLDVMHLANKDGIIEMLKDKGYKVKPVR